MLALQRLKEAAERPRSSCPTGTQTDVNLPYITADATGPKHLNVKLTRAKLESLVGRTDRAHHCTLPHRHQGCRRERVRTFKT